MKLTYCVYVERSVDHPETAALMAPSVRSWQPPRWGVSGVGNFRDLAEAQGATGPLRSGLIYRSDALHRCRRPEIDQLTAMGIRRILDLRTDAEQGPASLFHQCGIVTVRIPMIKDEAVLAEQTDRLGPDALPEFYLDLAAANSGAIVLCIAEIIAGAADHEPLVIQGDTGTDRTGIVAALALSLAGLDEGRIALDYARSDTAEPATMLAFLSGMRRHYGSVEDFLAWGGTDRAELDRYTSVFR